MARISKEQIVPILLMLGVAVRVAWFPSIPNGLHHDEVIAAYNALTLLREGIEPYGHSYPVNLLSYDFGAPIVGAAIMMPFIAWFGPIAFAIRLPYLIAGCLTLPLMFLFLRRITDRQTAVFGLFLIAIAPGHIQLSRWALDLNILPFLLLLGAYLFAEAGARNSLPLTYASTIVFAVCIYAYGPALAVVPITLGLLFLHRLLTKQTSLQRTLPVLGLFAVLTAPMYLYVLMNSGALGWGTVHLGPVTIPKLWSRSRFMTEGVFGQTDFLGNVRYNMKSFLDALYHQHDGSVLNTLPEFGIVYGIGMLLAIGGLLKAVQMLRANPRDPVIIPVAWIIGAAALAPMLKVYVSRINAIFLPLIIFGALALRSLSSKPLLQRVVIGYLSLWFLAFLQGYFSVYAPAMADGNSAKGDLYGAVRYTSEKVPDGAVCITDQPTFVHLYPLLADEIPSAVFRAEFLDPQTMRTRRPIEHIGRFTFGLPRCDKHSLGYVVTQSEFLLFHGMDDRVHVEFFGNYVSITPA